MSDQPIGDGWWQASDGRWYAPELHPDHRPPAPDPSPPTDAGFEGFEPPVVGERIDSIPPPPGWAGPPESARRYPTVEPRSRPVGRIVAFVLGGVFLLLAGGCGVFIWSFRDEIADATIDFSEAVEADDPAVCAVTGIDFGDDYEIDATLSATSNAVDSHYRLDLEVVDPQDRVLGREEVVFRAMAPGEERTEAVFNAISASEPVDSATCKVTRVLRTNADG